MARILTDKPSSGQPVLIQATDLPYVAGVETWTTVLEANDFSVPGDEDDGATPDPDNAGRQILPGQLFMQAPLLVANKSGADGVVNVRILREDGTAVVLFPNQPAPPNDTVLVPVQGHVLLKADWQSLNGDRLQIAVSAAATFDAFGTAVESEMPTHAPDTESGI